MSVINQVLNQLEMRGEHFPVGQAMVRCVPAKREISNIKFVLMTFGLAVTGALLLQESQTGKADVAVSSHVQNRVHPVAKVVASTPEYVPKSGVTAINTAAAPTPDLQKSVELNSLVLSDPLHSDNASVQPAVEKINPLYEDKKYSSGASQTQKNKTKVSTSSIGSSMKQISKAQQADAEFRMAVALMQRGRIDDAQAGYEAALRLDARHDAARQALVVVLLKKKRGADAERVLRVRLNSKPDHTGFTMMLARIQVERGAVAEATQILEKALPYARSQADYQAFLAAMLQRQNRNNEAIEHYQVALQLSPDNGVWLMGYGISLQAAQRNGDAKVAFKHALETQTLNPDLQAFVRQKIKSL